MTLRCKLGDMCIVTKGTYSGAIVTTIQFWPKGSSVTKRNGVRAFSPEDGWIVDRKIIRPETNLPSYFRDSWLCPIPGDLEVDSREKLVEDELADAVS